MSTDRAQGPIDPEDRSARNERLHRFAHDLRNKMEGLHQAYRLARSPDAAELGAELDAMAERSFFNGVAAIEALLNDFDVPRDPTSISLVPIDLRSLVERVVQGQAFRLKRKEQLVRVDIPALQVQADEPLLDQLLEAAISNAIKFSPDHSTISITAEQEADRAVVHITDPGVGLTSEDLGRILERYAILSSRTTNGEMQNRGTLARAQRWAAVQGIALSHGSAGPGKGTTCTLRIPLA